MVGLKGRLVRLLRTKVMRILVERPLRSLLEGVFPWFARTFGTRRDAMWASYRAWQEGTRGRWPDAIYWAKLALAADPTWGGGHHRLGTAYRGAGSPDRARQAYEQGMRAAPADYRIAMALGDLELEQQRDDAAETAYRRALTLQPENPEVLCKLAQTVVQNLQRADEARQLLEHALELAPGDAQVLRVLGFTRYAQQDLPGALTVLTEATARDPMQPFSYYYLAQTLAALGRREEALAALRQALALDPDEERFHALHAFLLEPVVPDQPGGDGRAAPI